MLLGLTYQLMRFITDLVLVRTRSDAQLRAEVLALRHQLSQLAISSAQTWRRRRQYSVIDLDLSRRQLSGSARGSERDLLAADALDHAEPTAGQRGYSGGGYQITNKRWIRG